MSSGSSLRRPSSRSLCLALVALTLAQIVVAIVMRVLLWPNVGLLVLLRSFMFEDLLVIAGYAAGGAVLVLLARRFPAMHGAAALLAWSVGAAHVALLAVNYSAVFWLRSPLTLSWLQTADLGVGETPLVMLRAVVSAKAVLGLCGALALPLVLASLLRLAPMRAVAGSPLALVGLSLGCAVVALTGRPAKADQWHDAVSSPAVEFWLSLRQNRFRELLERDGDGRSADYALRPAEPPLATGGARPDLLIVVLESVNARAVAEDITNLPTIARLTREGTVYPNASVSVAASSRSMFSLVYSRHPRLSYKFDPLAIETGYPASFQSALHRVGYETVFIQGGDFAFHGTDMMLARHDAGPLRDYGTITCDKRSDRSSARLKDNVYLPDRCTYAEAERWFLERQGPRAAVVWPVATHFPYDFEPEVTGLPGTKQAYLQALRHSDRLLGEMLERLAARGINPVVIVMADHGETFGEHGAVMHGQTMFQEEVAIPLILAGPGVPPGRVDRRLAHTTDIAPTVVSLAGAARPCGWQGFSLLGEARRARAYSFAFMRRPLAGYREGDDKYMLDLRDGTVQRFDLARDPGEMLPLAVSAGDAERVRSALAGWARYNAGLYNHDGLAGDGCAPPALPQD